MSTAPIMHYYMYRVQNDEDSETHQTKEMARNGSKPTKAVPNHGDEKATSTVCPMVWTVRLFDTFWRFTRVR